MDVGHCTGQMPSQTVRDGAWGRAGDPVSQRGGGSGCRSDPGYMSRKNQKFWTDKFDTWNKQKFWFMNSCKRLGTSRLHELHKSKLLFVSRIESVQNFRFFLLMYPGSVSHIPARLPPQTRHGWTWSTRSPSAWYCWYGWTWHNQVGVRTRLIGWFDAWENGSSMINVEL